MYIILWGIKQIWCLQQLIIISTQYFCLIVVIKSLPLASFWNWLYGKVSFGCCFDLRVFFNYAVIYGCAASLLLRRLALVAVSGAALHLSLRASHSGGFSCCRVQALGQGLPSCSTWAQQLWRTALVVLRHVGSPRTRDRTHGPCIGRQILSHSTGREVLI